MRRLTAAEAKVLRALLVPSLQTQAERVRCAGVPLATYKAVRRRAVLGNWIVERLVPEPSFIGFPLVSVNVAQPFVELRARVLMGLRADAGVVVLWVMPETLLWVEFRARSAAPQAPTPGGSDPRFRTDWTVSIDTETTNIPVYFDFEGAWSRNMLPGAPVAYPTGLGGTGGDLPHSSRTASRISHAVDGLLRHPYSLAPANDLGSALSRLSTPWVQRRLLRVGVVTKRTFLSLPGLLSSRELGFKHAVFATGQIRERVLAEKLLTDLADSYGISPFLFAVDSERVILGTLSPNPRGMSRPRNAVVELLSRYLRNIEVVREDLQSLFPAIDHRYDRLISLLPKARATAG